MLVMHFTIKVIPLVFKYLVDNLQLYYQLYTSYRIIIIIILNIFDVLGLINYLDDNQIIEVGY
jgi:hypothetical protein